MVAAPGSPVSRHIGLTSPNSLSLTGSVAGRESMSNLTSLRQSRNGWPRSPASPQRRTSGWTPGPLPSLICSSDLVWSSRQTSRRCCCEIISAGMSPGTRCWRGRHGRNGPWSGILRSAGRSSGSWSPSWRGMRRRSHAQGTTDLTRRQVTTFRTFLTSDVPVSAISEKTVRDFHAHCIGKLAAKNCGGTGWSPDYASKTFSTFRRFITYLVEDGMILAPRTSAPNRSSFRNVRGRLDHDQGGSASV